MTDDNQNHFRFRIARERAGLTEAETAAALGLSDACVWDLQGYPEELMSIYTPVDVQKFAALFRVKPIELLGIEPRDDQLTVNDIAHLIEDYCRARKLTVEDFSNETGWDIAGVEKNPDLLLSKLSLDGTVDICNALGVEWERFASSW